MHRALARKMFAHHGSIMTWAITFYVYIYIYNLQWKYIGCSENNKHFKHCLPRNSNGLLQTLFAVFTTFEFGSSNNHKLFSEAERQRVRETQRQRDRQTEKQRDTETERHRNTETQIRFQSVGLEISDVMFWFQMLHTYHSCYDFKFHISGFRFQV